MSPGPALPRPLRPRRLSLCCLSLLSLCCLSLLSLCRLSLLSLFFPRSQIQSWFPAWFTVLPQSGGLQSRLLRPGGLQSRLLRPGGLQSRLLRPGGLQSRLLRLGGLQVRLLHPGRSQSRLLRLGGLQVRLLHPGGSQSRLLRPGGLQVRLLRPGGLQCHPLRLGFHMDLALRPSPCSASAPPPTMDCLGASGSRSLGGGYVTNPGHELCFTPHSQSQITQGLHFPSSTAPTQLSALITHTPANNHPITITQSHTHTHTLHKPWTFSHSLPSIVSQSTYKAFSLVSLVCLPVFRFRPCLWIILSALPTGLSLPIADPRLPKDYSSVLSMPYPFAPARPCLY